jgi:hypothetical protein
VSDPAHVKLSQQEALVLHAWLAEHMGSLPIRDQAEQRVLWDLEASLEKQVTALFSTAYSDELAAARAAVRDTVE